ncbi:sigma-70 family RNA polymerase sigma factor [Duganella sp. LX20W]|uniref:Sigma-70 family RNA polymerase sigma factor n=1 Tax=Rugamonas brunnea TaxID=2758569 RepID=A0A7W2ESW8_9BURK|nr:sigma-70 family RNA polymerase sigma factor [Rugamonas brunnea]MBA5638034.1 sigma-70 family RNA polymerase sigma factor [Rugamonas brunnea]
MREGRNLDGQAAGGGEAGLLARIVAGDRHAFEQLYRAYFPRLGRFLGRMLRSVPLIEEVINDTMLVVWQKAASYNGSCQVSTWIFAIAYRKALKGLRGSDEPLECDTESYPAGPELEPDHVLEGRQLRQVLEQALAQLPLAQRVVMVLTYDHEMGYAEIAEVVGCPVNTVKTRMFHARHKLKELLASQMEDYS